MEVIKKFIHSVKYKYIWDFFLQGGMFMDLCNRELLRNFKKISTPTHTFVICSCNKNRVVTQVSAATPQG